MQLTSRMLRPSWAERVNWSSVPGTDASAGSTGVASEEPLRSISCSSLKVAAEAQAQLKTRHRLTSRAKSFFMMHDSFRNAMHTLGFDASVAHPAGEVNQRAAHACARTAPACSFFSVAAPAAGAVAPAAAPAAALVLHHFHHNRRDDQEKDSADNPCCHA